MRIVKLTKGRTLAADFWIFVGFKSAEEKKSAIQQKTLFDRFQCEFSLSSQIRWVKEQNVRRLVSGRRPVQLSWV